MPSGEGTNDAPALRPRLRDVYWLGGGSCAGKSTIARRIADQYGLQLYATDNMMADHARRSKPGDSPLLHKFISMSMDERWVNRSPATMLQTFHWFRGEGFHRIIEDLLCIPAGTRVIVEGFRVLPHLVQPILSSSDHAIWLIPSPEFRRNVMERRGGSAFGFLAETSDPERALRNLQQRDAMFTDRLSKEVEQLGLRAIQVHAATRENDSVNLVAALFGL